ncbi:unnamed protein product [Brassica rapa subsp. narinosa]
MIIIQDSDFQPTHKLYQLIWFLFLSCVRMVFVSYLITETGLRSHHHSV